GRREPSLARTQGASIPGVLARPRTQRDDGSQPQPPTASPILYLSQRPGPREISINHLGHRVKGWIAIGLLAVLVILLFLRDREPATLPQAASPPVGTAAAEAAGQSSAQGSAAPADSQSQS